jgi:hypothetical protein
MTVSPPQENADDEGVVTQDDRPHVCRGSGCPHLNTNDPSQALDWHHYIHGLRH